jgi:hypothetical protein
MRFPTLVAAKMGTLGPIARRPSGGGRVASGPAPAAAGARGSIVAGARGSSLRRLAPGCSVRPKASPHSAKASPHYRQALLQASSVCQLSSGWTPLRGFRLISSIITAWLRHNLSSLEAYATLRLGASYSHFQNFRSLEITGPSEGGKETL